ncbi:DNA polymerase-3 subunit epsilon [Algoriphagus boseongensis]|uniref:DNA polymerase-3 subunit epsilon n=1 Tax=Algoriphagus boseongensis TaxID=1442587 RepID=A0A4R6T9C0_9BACT|nr:exonuclease domain-containing protein [Algoriphagus boseongensis]TDQ19351.1 DNA polymerase-3 subunit epsilon [Algoriphagus boseongensis]
MEFAIVDIETTGGSPAGGGITEIAVLIHNGQEITDEYQTLINPGHSVPPYITGLTGIDNSMVANAPTFEEIADELWELLDGRVFVAHQVNFDFSFIREAFAIQGRNLNSSRICTVRLARKVFPGLGSYSLGRLCESQKIPILARHRAMGDARATAILFDRMYKLKEETILSSLKRNAGESFLPPNFSLSKFKEIPEFCGVYYMLNDKGKVIYVGKALNIRERFKGHFSGKVLPHLKQQLKAEITSLEWKLTGSEMMALLLETLEIKRLWPKYNSALKLPKTLWGLFEYQDSSGYYRFQIAKVTRNLRPLETFFSSEEAQQFLKSGIESFQLCQKLCGLRKVTCQTIQDQNCKGACQSGETPKKYNSRASEFISLIRKSKKDLLLTLPGRNSGEKALCQFEGGMLSRFGFVKEEEESLESLEVVPRIPETFYVLRQFLPTLDLETIKILDPSPSTTPSLF